eukprot:gene18013-15671_t
MRRRPRCRVAAACAAAAAAAPAATAGVDCAPCREGARWAARPNCVPVFAGWRISERWRREGTIRFDTHECSRSVEVRGELAGVEFN